MDMDHSFCSPSFCYTYIAHIQKLKLVSRTEEGWTGDKVDL